MTIEELQSAVTAAQITLNEWYKEQLIRLPDQDAWDALTQEQKITEWDTEGALKFALRAAKKALEIEQTRREEFYAARQDAFDTFESEKATERGVLNALWQEKEDNNFDINYNPDSGDISV